MSMKYIVGEAMIELAKKYPGFPVAVYWDGDLLHYGVIGLELEPQDWFLFPGPLTQLMGDDLPESIALNVENKKPQNAAAGGSDPGGTRTLNQLIKSQPLSPTPAKDK